MKQHTVTDYLAMSIQMEDFYTDLVESPDGVIMREVELESGVGWACRRLIDRAHTLAGIIDETWARKEIWGVVLRTMVIWHRG